jgi:hypothetical protein
VVPAYASQPPLHIEDRVLLSNTCEQLLLTKRPFGHVIGHNDQCLITYQTPYELNQSVVSELGARLRHDGGLSQLSSIDVIHYSDTQMIRFLFNVNK